jgi:hypothetical protein
MPQLSTNAKLGFALLIFSFVASALVLYGFAQLVD